MKRFLLSSSFSLSICLLITTLAAPIRSEVHVDTFHSPTLDRDRSMQVHLPDGYDPELAGGYPVVYFLHGMGGDHQSSWYEVVHTIFDDLISTGTIEPMILVKPDGGTTFLGDEGYVDFGGSAWLDSELYGEFEQYLVFDVPDTIEARYNASPQAERRAIIGSSMGAFGALNAGLNHDDRFRAVASLSGFPDFTQFVDWFDHVIAESPHFDYHPANGAFTQGAFLLAGACSPNLTNPPYYVDFPLDEFGEIIPAVYEDLWIPRGGVASASTLPLDTPLKFYFDCGTNDSFFFLPFNSSFVTALEGLGFMHDDSWSPGEMVNGHYVFWEFPGSHFSHFEIQFERALQFVNAAMLQPLAADDRPTGIPSARLHGNHPNPFNPRTTISFTTDRDLQAMLGVYDLTGQSVAVLADRLFPAGSHTVIWDGRDARGRGMPSGSYVVRLATDSGVKLQKVMLLR